MFRPRCCCLAVLAALSAGCSSYYTYYQKSAEREILEILESKRDYAVDRWQKNAKMPEPEKAPAPVKTEGNPGEARVLSLRDALRIATQNNRSFKSQRESVDLAALSAALERHNFGPVISNTISYVSTQTSSADGSRTNTGTGRADFSVRQILPTGGTLRASSAGTKVTDRRNGGPSTYSHDITVSFEQPLLRGAGREVAYEGLTQAERDVVYALRDFELFRQDFSLEVLMKYYAILRQKQVVENSRHTLEQFTFLRKRSDALFEVGKVATIDRYRAKQEELTASNNLITEEETLSASLDDFKVLLGLPVSARIDVEDTRPEVKAAHIDLKSALGAALHNRLDLKTVVEQLEDAERRLRISRNGLLPDLDLSASYTIGGTKTGDVSTFYRDRSRSLGIALSLPLDKVSDRNAYKRALINRHRQMRFLTLSRDHIKVEVLNTYRRLRRLENSIRIQKANLELAEKRVENAKLRFEAGELGNRDVVEAQSAKLRAQNALIRAILDYEVARLQLKRDIGILFLDSDGMWKK